METWARLFERAAVFDVSEESISETLAERRDDDA
jgi:hypothetical protein